MSDTQEGSTRLSGPDSGPAAVPAGLTLAANWYVTRAHYVPSDAMRNYSLHQPGREGLALCGSSQVYDQEFHDGFDRCTRRVVADLPLCKLCERSARNRSEVTE